MWDVVIFVRFVIAEFKFVCSGSMFVSLCKCWMFVSNVRPVAIYNAMSCIVCSFVMYVVDAICDHILGAYSSIGLVTDLYVESNVSLCCL